MNELKVIEEREVLGKNFKFYGNIENPLFLAKDVAEWIEHNKPNEMIRNVDNDEKVKIFINPSDNIARVLQPNTEYWFLTENGLYEVLMQSRKPIAKQFKKEVKEILKTIRKHGAYITPEKLEEFILNPDMIIKLCIALKEERDKNSNLQIANSQLTVDNQIMKPKADYFDELVERNLLTSFRDTAKQFKVKERDFIKILMDKKFIYRDKKGNLKPYAKRSEGLFEVKECCNNKTKWCGTQTLITPKGRETFRILLSAS